MPLPTIMVAPNGAHKSKADHPALPITIAEVVATALQCRDAGAEGMHAHVRDVDGHHVLDAGLYRELLDECDRQMPGFYVQITTEAVGRYSPREQDQVVRDVNPKAVSVALAEMLDGEKAANGDVEFARQFYAWAKSAGIDVQHILYEPSQLRTLRQFVNGGIIDGNDLQVLFVLGRYVADQQSTPEDLEPFIQALQEDVWENIDWAVCAFGNRETECLIKALQVGGKVRIGFENNLWMRDGSLARDNCARVGELVEAIHRINN